METEIFTCKYFKFDRNTTGLNQSHLRNFFASSINQKIPEWLGGFEEVIDKRVLWDLIKYRVRQFTMHYAKEKAHKRRQELVQIEMSLRQTEERLAIDPSESNLEILEDLKMKYDSHFDYIAKGAIIRSNWYEKGEKKLHS